VSLTDGGACGERIGCDPDDPALVPGVVGVPTLEPAPAVPPAGAVGRAGDDGRFGVVCPVPGEEPGVGVEAPGVVVEGGRATAGDGVGDALPYEAAPYDVDAPDVGVGRVVGLSVLKKRTASIPSAKALPANTIGCRRANRSMSVTIWLVS